MYISTGGWIWPIEHRLPPTLKAASVDRSKMAKRSLRQQLPILSELARSRQNEPIECVATSSAMQVVPTPRAVVISPANR